MNWRCRSIASRRSGSPDPFWATAGRTRGIQSPSPYSFIDTIVSSSRRVLSAPSRSDLLATKISAISRIPALMAWMSPPSPGTTTTRLVWATLTISPSSCPTPTVSMITTSFPMASITLTMSMVDLERPPRCPRVARLLMNTPASRVCFCMRMRSPRIAPPENGLVGSMATIPTVFPFSRRCPIRQSTRVDFPAPGAPVMPRRYALPVCRYRVFRVLCAEGISSSRSRIRRAAAWMSPERMSFAGIAIRSVPPDEAPGDDHALHLRSPLADLAQFCVPHCPLHGVLTGVPVAPEDLNGLDRGPHGGLGGEKLRDRRLLDERLPGVFPIGGPEREQLCRIELRPRVRDHPLDGLEGRNRIG